MSNNKEPEDCSVSVKLLDVLGNPIVGLTYRIMAGTVAVAKGVTDGNGKMQSFSSVIGTPLSVHVEHFLSGAMTPIRTFTPWQQKFPVKLVSGKFKTF